MTYWPLAAALTLASFAVVIAALSMMVALVAPALVRRVDRSAPSTRARVFFTLRMLPMAAASAIAIGIILPTFLWFEPADAGETIALSLGLAATAGAWVLMTAVRRGGGAWHATRRLARTWRDDGERVDSLDAPLPVYAIDYDYPIVAVVGFRRPELFISRQVLGACSPAEVRAMVMHESAHVAAGDNLKRLALHVSAGTQPGTRALDGLWASAAEEAADARAAASRPDLMVDLAQALIRVARLAVDAPVHVPASAFYSGGSIDARVHRLLDRAPEDVSNESPVLAGAVALAIIVATGAIAFAPALHHTLEAIVRTLP